MQGKGGRPLPSGSRRLACSRLARFRASACKGVNISRSPRRLPGRRQICGLRAGLRAGWPGPIWPIGLAMAGPNMPDIGLLRPG